MFNSLTLYITILKRLCTTINFQGIIYLNADNAEYKNDYNDRKIIS
jgi:hypothetical protein